jgi:hypothetical protein
MVAKKMEWPYALGQFRDNLAEILLAHNDMLLAIHARELPEGEEDILDSVVKHNTRMIMALQQSGARIDPLTEVEKIAFNLKKITA